jgi:hypothetical protein
MIDRPLPAETPDAGGPHLRSASSPTSESFSDRQAGSGTPDAGGPHLRSASSPTSESFSDRQAGSGTPDAGGPHLRSASSPTSESFSDRQAGSGTPALNQPERHDDASPQAFLSQLARYSVAPDFLASFLEALPSRLRRKLETEQNLTDGWTATIESTVESTVESTIGAERLTIDAGNDTTLHLGTQRVIVSTDNDLHCSCLLAPRCLHRGALLLSLAIHDEPHGDEAAETEDNTLQSATDTELQDGTQRSQTHNGEDPTFTDDLRAPDDRLPLATAGPIDATAPADLVVLPGLAVPSASQRLAAQAVWDAAAPIILQGIANSGSLRLASLLRAANVCRAEGLHLLARAAVALAAQLQRRQRGDASFVLAEATNDVRIVLSDAWRLSTQAHVPEYLLKSGTRSFSAQGGLRLTALACEPVIAASGYAGVVTHLIDASGSPRHLAQVMPGGPQDVKTSYQTAIRIGDTTINHDRLSRAGLIVSGATVAPDGRLGAGAGVKAAPSRSSVLVPLDLSNVAARAQASLNGQPAQPLVVCLARILATDRNQLVVALENPLSDTNQANEEDETSATEDQEQADDQLADAAQENDAPTQRLAYLSATSNHQSLPANDNLRLLGKYVGLRIVLCAEVVPAPIPTLRLLSFSCVNEADCTFPSTWEQRCNAGLDRLEPSMIRFRPGDQPLQSASGHSQSSSAPGVDVIGEVRRMTERVASLGTVALQTTIGNEGDRLVRSLRRHSLNHGASLLEHFNEVRHTTEREVDGRLRPPSTSQCAQAWLALATWETNAQTQLAIAAWNP